MDVSDLLPNLVKMMEDRFGLLGRPVTTALLAALAIYVFILCYEAVDRAIIDPVAGLVERGYGKDMVYLAGRMVVYVLLIIAFMTLIYKWKENRLTKRATILRRRIEAALEDLGNERQAMAALVEKAETLIPPLEERGERDP